MYTQNTALLLIKVSRVRVSDGSPVKPSHRRERRFFAAWIRGGVMKIVPVSCHSWDGRKKREVKVCKNK